MGPGLLCLRTESPPPGTWDGGGRHGAVRRAEVSPCPGTRLALGWTEALRQGREVVCVCRGAEVTSHA